MQENVNIPDSNITTNLSFRQLVLMNIQQLTNFPYIEKDFDALTDYELLCLVVKYLNDVITNQNEQNDSITRMYESFLALQTYVNNTKDTLEDAFNNLDNYVRNYFANLDVQEEINNKLDDMLEDGVLEQIIEQFLQLTSLICFDTVAGMKSSVNLANGSYAKTLGYHTKNDGGESTYKIRTITNDDVVDEMFIIEMENDNTLIAELIYDNINVKQLGAYGDGIHDDYDSINAAIEKCYDVYIPDGTYLITTKLNIEKSINLHGNGRTSKILSSNDIILIECSGNSDTVKIHDLEIKNSITGRINEGVYIHNIADASVNNVYFNNIETGGKFELYIKSVVTSSIERNIFNHTSLRLETWDAKVDKCWIWALSQNYGILVSGNSGNINITNTDIVPPLQSNSNYITHGNMRTSWDTAKLQAGIVIGNGSAVVNVKMTNIYIDGNASLTTGRGIIVNANCHNILIDDWSANYTNDDLVIIDSSFGVTVSNGQITDCYGNDCCLIQVIKTATQGCHSMSIFNNVILLKDTTQTSNKLRSVIEAVESYGGTITYNKAFYSGATKLYNNGINVNYNSNLLLYTNRFQGYDFYSHVTGTIATSATGKSINYGTFGFPYLPDLSNIEFRTNKLRYYRIQQIDNSSIYVEFNSAFENDGTFDLTVKL